MADQAASVRAARLLQPPVIAIVDDDEAVREALADLLQVMGFSAQAFDRADAFLADYAPGRFDCLITDVRMPGIGGLALQQRLRALGSAMPVIIITSYTDPITRARALEGGARAFLTKPVADDFLLHHLRSALGQDGAEEEAGGKEPVGR
jgi:FixJ family two-component response regulator